MFTLVVQDCHVSVWNFNALEELAIHWCVVHCWLVVNSGEERNCHHTKCNKKGSDMGTNVLLQSTILRYRSFSP
jgi:hypothetical protein